MCHAAEPAWDGIVRQPNGLFLGTEHQIAARVSEIFLHSGFIKAMPPTDISFMETKEHVPIRKWWRAGVAES